MKLKDIYNQENTVISFEIFPPKDDINKEKTYKLLDEVEILNKYNPALISVTYGAGGSNKENSFELVKSLVNKGINVMPHFTCVCTKKEDIDKYINDLKGLNIENILALRGDEPEDITICYRDFRYANELVEYLKSTTKFSIAVAGYPEGHPNSETLDDDITNLKKKVTAGADIIYTQMLFDNNQLYNYIEKLQTKNINIPVIPGILPVLSFKQLDKMLSLAKVTVPKKLMSKFEKYQDNSDDIKKVSIDWACEQCQELINNKIKGLHFYTLNKSFSVSKILDCISI